MIKTLINNLKLVKQINTTSTRYVTSSINNKPNVKKTTKLDDEFEYQNDDSSGIRNLEKLGVAKSYWSWPQYNRTIYPPTDDGKPAITPVCTILLLII